MDSISRSPGSEMTFQCLTPPEGSTVHLGVKNGSEGLHSSPGSKERSEAEKARMD